MHLNHRQCRRFHAEIASFCAATFGVEFPMYSKIAATGANRHALYDPLTAAGPETEDRAGMESMLRGHGIEPTAAPEVVRNVEKFLISGDGRGVRRFSPDTAPDAAKLLAAIETKMAMGWKVVNTPFTRIGAAQPACALDSKACNL